MADFVGLTFCFILLSSFAVILLLITTHRNIKKELRWLEQLEEIKNLPEKEEVSK